jgi:alanine dehydrogenase
MAYLDDVFSTHITTLYSSPANVERVLRESDLVVGAVLVPGAVAPRLVSRRQLALMKPGAVLVDVAIDQGGCFETSRPTSHDNPIYNVDGIIHYCVANMPGAVCLTSTIGLTNVTLRYGLMIADMGLEAACQAAPAFAKGVNLYRGHCVYNHVAEAFNLPVTPLAEVIAA